MLHSAVGLFRFSQALRSASAAPMFGGIGTVLTWSAHWSGSIKRSMEA